MQVWICGFVALVQGRIIYQAFKLQYLLGTVHLRHQHFLGGGVKNLPNLRTDRSKKLPMGVGVKNQEKFVNVLNG